MKLYQFMDLETFMSHVHNQQTECWVVELILSFHQIMTNIEQAEPFQGIVVFVMIHMGQNVMPFVGKFGSRKSKISFYKALKCLFNEENIEDFT